MGCPHVNATCGAQFCFSPLTILRVFKGRGVSAHRATSSSEEPEGSVSPPLHMLFTQPASSRLLRLHPSLLLSVFQYAFSCVSIISLPPSLPCPPPGTFIGQTGTETAPKLKLPTWTAPTEGSSCMTTWACPTGWPSMPTHPSSAGWTQVTPGLGRGFFKPNNYCYPHPASPGRTSRGCYGKGPNFFFPAQK